MTSKAPALAVLLLVSAIAVPVFPTAAGNEAPLAEAGLDQEVAKGTTVLLDAAESRDPDGRIERYEWSIRTPSNDTITPDCPDCARTQFVASQVGTYEVTVIVTDDDGATSSDTLYVIVSPGTGPRIALSGPSNPTIGTAVTYSASVEAGAADLDHVRWFVDGERVATHEVSGGRETDTLARTFPTETDHAITARVYDEDDQHASDSLSVHVRPSDSNDGNSSLASRGSPTIHGPRAVLGMRPLRASYTASLDLGSRDVAGVEWHTMDGEVGSGNAEAIAWSPGDHQLFAVVTYVDGSTNVARFPDGTTTVVADPKPNASLSGVSRHGQISGRATATDSYGNLQSLAVFVDGEQVVQREVNEVQLRNHGGSSWLSTMFTYEDVTPQEPHSVRVVATDARGQSTEYTRTVTPTGEPEIVRSEFVNDPVDSYHERINASRYAAHHVLEIDLNGVDPANVSLEYEHKKDALFRLNESAKSSGRKYDKRDDELVFHSFWAGTDPGVYPLKSHAVLTNTRNSESKYNAKRSLLKVEPSQPELRYRVIDTGRTGHVSDWGLVVDAGRSFDPDGTNISYIWKYGANPISPDNSTAKFDSFERAGLTIEDGDGLKTTNDEEFLGYYNPGVLAAREVSEGPYKPNETVQFRVFTSHYELTKNRYDVNLGLDVPHETGQMRGWEEVHIDNGECRNSTCSYRVPLPERLDVDNRRYRYYTGIVEIEASAFANGTYDPNVILYNTEHPDRTKQEFTLPQANVLTKGEKYWENVTVSNLSYKIERPNYEWVTAYNEPVRDEYLEENYSVASTDATLAYVVEHRVKTQNAKYETESKSFQRRSYRQSFLSNHPSWYDAGTNATTKTHTTTETEWRDSKGGNGTFTGQTREKLIKAAQYKAERKYEYEYQVEKTGTKEVTKTKYRWVQKTGTRTVTKCNEIVGCYESTETYTYWDKEPYTYTTTKTYTYYETKTDTYWATARRHSDHEFTGESREVKLSDAEYETQYEYEYEVKNTRTVYRYLVERQVVAEPAEYEWQEYEVVSNKLAAQAMASQRDDWRIGSTQSDTKWTLKRYNGTETEVVESYDESGDVVETRANIAGNLKQVYINIRTGNKTTYNTGWKESTVTWRVMKTKGEIIKLLTDTNGGEDSIRCGLKPHC